MDALVRLDAQTLRLLDVAAVEGKGAVGAQIVGSKVELAAPCVEILQEMGFAAIDLNCGCPVDKVTKDGGGSGLLKDPYKIGQILRAMVSVAKVPISVKIRAGWHEGELLAPLICQIAQDAGATAISVHGRTRMQGYRGPADWSTIAACRPRCSSILLIANGDILDGPSAKKAFEVTGADALLLSRGTLGSPFVIEEVRSYLSGSSFSISLAERVALMITHYEEVRRYHNSTSAAIEMRKIVCWYLKDETGLEPTKQQGLKQFKQKLAREKNPEAIEKLLEELVLFVN